VTIIARRQEFLDETVSLLKKLRGDTDQQILALSTDVTDKIQVANAVETACKQLGTPRCLFTCAGVSIPGLFLDTGVEVFEKEMQLNYFGTLFITKVSRMEDTSDHTCSVVPMRIDHDRT
jgi:NAD(P)-dependent dehydrogenase (short-subunit alcohol dehydrogenase family)